MHGYNYKFLQFCPKESVFSGGLWSTMMGLVKNRRSISEYLDAPQIRQDLQEIQDLYQQESKEKKKQMKKEAGEQLEEEDQVKDEAEPNEADEEMEPESKATVHMLVGEEPNLPIKENLKGPQQEKAQLVVSLYLGINNLKFNHDHNLKLKMCYLSRLLSSRTSCCNSRRLLKERSFGLIAEPLHFLFLTDLLSGGHHSEIDRRPRL